MSTAVVPVREPRARSGYVLPTHRIAFAKQLDILRAYAAASGPERKAVNRNDIAKMMELSATTIGLALPFFSATGFLREESSGIVPSPEVFAFQLANEWDPNTASQKLAPLLERQWFTERIMPKLRFSPVSEDDAITMLAEEASAGPDYKPQLRMILNYLCECGLTRRVDGKLQAGAERNEQTSPKQNANGQHELRDESPSVSAVSTGFSNPGDGVVQFHIDVRVDMAELSTWSADRIAAFFSGVAQVLTAKGRMEQAQSNP